MCVIKPWNKFCIEFTVRKKKLSKSCLFSAARVAWRCLLDIVWVLQLFKERRKSVWYRSPESLSKKILDQKWLKFSSRFNCNSLCWPFLFILQYIIYHITKNVKHLIKLLHIIKYSLKQYTIFLFCIDSFQMSQACIMNIIMNFIFKKLYPNKFIIKIMIMKFILITCNV